MALPGVTDLPAEVALDHIGHLIDLSADLEREDGAVRALEWADELERRGIPERSKPVAAYFRANAWAVRYGCRQKERTAAWAWQQPELEREIFHLRAAARHPAAEGLGAIRQCQIWTNLGNTLNTLGRFVEAIEYWDRALNLSPRFAMALGNRAYGLKGYARVLYDGGHQAVFLRLAHSGFAAAIAPEAMYDSPQQQGASRQFAAEKAAIEELLGEERLSTEFDLDKHALGNSEEEINYRRWCLRHRLFVNPLNDLGDHSIAARDVLTLPSFVTEIEEPPTLVGLFNQMKQEFVAARWLLYDGTCPAEPHFSDRDVLLYNTLDYPIYSLAIEKVKAAYRAAYSLFDKSGFFLNAYMKLGVPQNEVTFRKIWHDKGKRTVRAEFDQSENWAMRGLFWLSRDLFEPEFHDVTDPDAQEISQIRNHLEHKYLKVHDPLFRALEERVGSGPWNDRLAHSVLRPDFEAKTLRLLKLARAALIYVSLGVHIEESRRSRHRAGRVASMPLDTWDDDWKR